MKLHFTVAIFWNMMPCNLVPIQQYGGGTLSFHLHDGKERRKKWYAARALFEMEVLGRYLISNIMTNVTVDMQKFDVPAHAVECPERTKRHQQYLQGSNRGKFPVTAVGAFRCSPVQDWDSARLNIRILTQNWTFYKTVTIIQGDNEVSSQYK